MRKGLLGSIAALAAGAGAAWGQSPVEPTPLPAGVPGVGAPLGGSPAVGGAGAGAPAPVIMPPGNYGPADDPLGLGPVGGFGPPPGPMYPMPGPYGAQSYQPAPAGGAGELGSAPRWWVDGEYLLWFTKGQPVRYPLLTSSAPADQGVLGAASTVALVDRGTLGYNAMSGMRLSAGFFGDADRRFGFNLTGFFTEKRSNIQDFGGLGNFSGIPVLARPFVDANQVTSTIVLSSADFGPASVQVGTSTSTFSIEPSAVWNLYRSAPGARRSWSVDFLAGYRFFQLKEDLWIDSLTALNSGVVLPIFQTGPFGIVTQVGTRVVPNQTNFGGVIIQTPSFINVRDSFRATNNFNGASFGLRSEARCGIVSASASAKISIGNLHQRLDIFGGSSFIDFTGVSGSQINNTVARGTGGGAGGAYGGVLANPSNIGTYTDDRFTYMPEFGGTLGIALTRGLTGYVGVNFLYLPDVIRPGNQVNPVVSSAAIPFGSNYGTANAVRGPGVSLLQSDYWLGGVTFGLQVRY